MMNYTMPGISGGRGQSNALTGMVRMSNGQGASQTGEQGQTWGGWNRRGVGDDRRRGLYGGGPPQTPSMDGGVGDGIYGGARAPQPTNALTGGQMGWPTGQSDYEPSGSVTGVAAPQQAQVQSPAQYQPIYTAPAPTAPQMQPVQQQPIYTATSPPSSEIVGGAYGAPEPEMDATAITQKYGLMNRR